MVKTTEVKITDIELDPQNAREHDEANRDAIKASLDRFGPGRSIVIDSKDTVRAGNGTVEAAIEAGFESVFVVEPEPGQLVAVRRPEWSEAEAKGYGLADNRASELARWNIAALSDVIASIPEIDPGDMGFSAEQLDALIGDASKPGPGLSGDTTAPDPPGEPTTKPGDVWALGEHRLLCYDSQVVVPTLGAVDCVITDPPYDQRTHDGAMYEGGKATSKIDFEPLDVRRAVPMMLGAAKRWVVAFCTLEMLGEYQAISGDAWIRSGLWRSPNRAPQFTGDRPAVPADGVAIMHGAGKKHWNGGGHHAYWEHPTEQQGRSHPTQKPLGLMVELLEAFTDFGESVLDPYAGSGTTLLACHQLGRTCVAVEQLPSYCDVIKARWETATGERAKRIAG